MSSGMSPRGRFVAGAVSALIVAAGTAWLPGATAWAAPQGSCSTGSYSESTVGSDTVGTFSSPSNTASSSGCTWSVPAGVNSVRVLVVAGGGGGGGYLTSGGGGAGGVLHEVGFAVTPGATLNISVGKGGATGTNAWNQPGNYNNGANGDDSVFGSLTAVGGGGGGGGGTNSQIGNPGSAGGSGGGGGRCWVTCNTGSTANSNKHAGGAGTAGQGNAGGHAWFMSGAGGGGAGAAGADDIYGFAGNGGDGVSVDISGSATYYGGGGGGGTENTTTRATGGLGGGGLGAATGNINGADGTAGTGGGGGGVRDGNGGNGGSGVVIVRWGSAPVAPSISLSNSSGYTLVNTAASSLYSITNTGGAVTSYSISPSLPSGLSFSTATGLISGTPTAVSSATNYTITARRVSASNGASSSSTATFNYGVYTVAPTTTTTTSTTSTTLAPATTVAAATTSVAPGTTVAVGGGGNGTTVPSSSSTVAVIRNSTAATSAPTSTTSTVPVTTTTVDPGPQAPDAAPGEGSASIDGESVDVELSRAENALTVSAAGVTATVYGIDSAGARVALNQEGNLALQEGETVVVEGSGYDTASLVEVWLHSTPVRLGTVTVDASGTAKGSFVIPQGAGTGDHRVLVSGSTSDGKEAVLAVGLRIGAWGKESNVSRWIILSTIALAISLGLVIPTTTRRRRKTAHV